MLRWRQFEYAPQPANIWKQAHTLFALADQNLLLKQPTTVYDGQAVTSIQALYVHLHMLGGLNYSNLNKAQLNLVSKLLQRWSLSVKTSHQMEHYHTFFTPLDKDKPAERIRKKTPLTPSLFWDLDEIEYDIQHNIQCLQMRKSPPLLQFIKINNQKLLLESLQFLQREWSKKHYVRQRRKESRRQSNKYISVTIGISEILQLLKRYNLEEDSVRSLMDGTLNDRRLPTSVVMRGPINTLLVGKEKWNIVDESQQGLGSLIPESLNQHIKLNKLVAIVSNYSDAKPAITAVRNIKQMTEGKVKIGLEILTEKPKLAVLRKLDLRKQDDVSAQSSLTPAFSLDSNSSYAIYIPQSSMLDRPASIIMSKLDHVANSLYEVSFQQSREVIKMTDPIEIGDDWVRISFPDINKQRKTI
jgi:hypothetical protein